MRRHLVVVGVVVFVVGSWWIRSRQTAALTDGRVDEPIVEVARGNLVLEVESTGRVVPERDIDITSKAGGEVLSVHVDVSDVVTRGTLLLELDPRDEDRRSRQIGINLDSAQARVDRARADLALATERRRLDLLSARKDLEAAEAEYADGVAKKKRVSVLFEAQSVSTEEYETATLQARLKELVLERARIRLLVLEAERSMLDMKRAELQQAKAQLASEQISVELAQQRLEDIRVLAPSDGVVAARYVQPGQIIASAMENVGGGTKLFTISDMSRRYVIASIDESDIGRVEIGQRARITCDAHPETMFRGEVIRIATRGDTTSNVVTFDVTVEVLGEERDLLRPEMTATVSIRVADRRDVMVLPSDAVRRDRRGPYVVLEADDRTQRIVTGVDDGMQVEVVSGLSIGDRVRGVVSPGLQWSRGGADRSQRMATGALMRGFGGGRP